MPRARKKPSAPGEGPNVEQQRHAVFVKADWQAKVDRLIYDATESKLRELEYLGALSARQREAGELFEADYWLVVPSTAPGDSTQPRIGGRSHETDAQIERVKRAASRVRSVKITAGTWYRALRDLAVFRQRVKLAAVVLPEVLDRVGDIYGLPRR